MSDANPIDCNLHRSDTNFTPILESDFAGFILSSLIDLLDRHNVKDPQISMSEYTGVILEKPALSITIGDSEYQILILKK
jgi:hypothetical protein